MPLRTRTGHPPGIRDIAAAMEAIFDGAKPHRERHCPLRKTPLLMIGA